MSSLVFGSHKFYVSLRKQGRSQHWLYLRMGHTLATLPDRLETVVIAGSPALAKRYGSTTTEQEFLEQCESLIDLYAPKNVILISSASVYGLVQTSSLPLTEDSYLAGDSAYALEKIRLEKHLASLSRKRPEVCFTVLRVSGLYNCFEPDRVNSLVDRLVRQAMAGKKDRFKIEHEGRQIRDFCNYDFLVELIVQLAKKPSPGLEVLNVKTTKGFIVSELTDYFCDASQVAMTASKDKAIHSELSVERLLGRLPDFGMDFHLALIDKVDKFTRIPAAHHKKRM